MACVYNRREAQSGIVFIAALGWRVCLLFRGDGLGVACVYNAMWRSEMSFIAAPSSKERTEKLERDIVRLRRDIVRLRRDVVKLEGDVVKLRGDVVKLGWDLVKLRRDVVNSVGML